MKPMLSPVSSIEFGSGGSMTADGAGASELPRCMVAAEPYGEILAKSRSGKLLIISALQPNKGGCHAIIGSSPHATE
jgi:hypothetical protein